MIDDIPIADHLVPVLEVGGTHVTAALVDLRQDAPAVPATVRTPLAHDGSAADILDSLAESARSVPAGPGAVWGVAVPGPFDYGAGVAWYRDVGKFDSLYGVDVGAELAGRLSGAGGFAFVNDAEAFTSGEWVFGAAAGHERVIGITLGTGIGSTFLESGKAVRVGPTVPPEGRVDLVRYAGRPLEETISRRALVAQHEALTGTATDVREMAELARSGDADAVRVLDEGFAHLGRALAPWFTSFTAGIVVVGGSMSASWDLFGPSVRRGMVEVAPALDELPMAVARRPVQAPLLGAALTARDAARR
jgi:glucokinase